MKEWAEKYRKLGLAVLRLKDSAEGAPINSRGKAPFDPGWTKTTPVSPLPEFLPLNNLGILLGNASGGVIRLDPEWPKTLPLLRILFPGDEAHRFGRPSARGNAIMFKCIGAKSKDWILPPSMKEDPRTPAHGNNLRGIVVAQVLSTGKQTMAPPSIHPTSGEELTWESFPDTWEEYEPAEVERLMGWFAALGVCIQYWPPPETTRAIATCALSRVLLDAFKRHVPDDEQRIKHVETLVECVTCCGGNGESGHGIRHVRDTFEKMADGRECAGFPKLLELLGLSERVGMSRTLRGWFGLQNDELLDVDDDRTKIISADHQRTMSKSLNEIEPTIVGDHFQQSGRVVKPIRYEINSGALSETKNGITTRAGALVLQAVSSTRLTETFNERGNWQQECWSAKKGAFLKPIACPPWAAKQYLARVGEWRLHVMKGIIEAPTLRADGTLLDRPGYDDASGLWLDTGGIEFDPIPDTPTREDGIAALKELKDAISLFPFVPDEEGAPFNSPSASRSVALSAFLTGLIRRSLYTAPLHGFTAPTMATGKTLLADCAGILAVGRPPTAMSQGADEEEDEKRLLSVLMRGDPVVLIDNVKRPIEGDGLCIVMSAPSWSCRILGETRNLTVASDVLMMATGNNLCCKGDMTARAIMCALDARMEAPEKRQFTGNLREWFVANRPHLVACGLTALRSYAAAGHPLDSADPEYIPPFARFEEWDRRVRKALIWLGEPDPNGTRQLVAGRDEVRSDLGEVLGAMVDNGLLAHAKAFQAKDVFTASLTDEALRAAFDAVCGPGGPNAKSIGRYLTKVSGRVVAGICVRRSAKADRLGAFNFSLEKR